MTGGTDRFFISMLDALAHGSNPYLNEDTLKTKTGFEKFEFEKMIDAIKTGMKDTKKPSDWKTSDPDLYKMVTKSLAILCFFSHGHDDDLEKVMSKYHIDKQKLIDMLSSIWGTAVTVGNGEYEKILNQ
ncbi:MAG: hypothetical protein LBR23_04040 [Spirochaetaceae bacterium]|jgi:hypothetical protein|nr:hypothetical protein [Spirochaetaceae bacterium]